MQILRKCGEMGGRREQEERHLGDIETGLRKWQMESCRAGGATCWAGRHCAPRAVTKGQQSQQHCWRNPLVMGTAFEKRRIKVQVCLISSLKSNTSFMNFPLPPQCSSCMAVARHSWDKPLPSWEGPSLSLAVLQTLVENSWSVYRVTKGPPLEAWFHI